MRDFRRLVCWTIIWATLVVAAFGTLSGCRRRQLSLPPPPKPVYSSVVMTDAGVVFYVDNLRTAGTRQELLVRQGGANQSLHLGLIQRIIFTGSVKDQYRPAIISLTSGERLTGEVFVDFILEGVTDLGYWNTPMERVNRLDVGSM